MKPKVIHILNRLNIGGIVPQVINTVKNLQDDFEVQLLSGVIESTEAGADYLLEGTNLKPILIPDMQRGIDIKKDFKAYHHIKKIIKDFKPDIVHTHAAKPGALGRLAAIHAKVPVVLHTFHGHVFHSYFGKAKTRFFLETERWLAKKSSALIAISQLQKREMVQDFKLCTSKKMKVINYGYELARFYTEVETKRTHFRKHWKIQKDELLIGIIGRLVPIKNHALFLKAFDKVVQQYPKKVKAVIIGDGEEKENIQQLCNTLQLSYTNQPNDEAKVTFTSWIKDIETAYAGIDILALSSLNEGTPISLIEAQAAGLPIITTDVGGVRDTILESSGVWVVPSDNVELFSKALLKQIEYIAHNKNVNLTENQQFVTEKFGLQQMITNIKQLYYSLLTEF